VPTRQGMTQLASRPRDSRMTEHRATDCARVPELSRDKKYLTLTKPHSPASPSHSTYRPSKKTTPHNFNPPHIMTDSPLYRLPLDPQEQPILERILNLRDSLSLLKQDRSTYVKSQDVLLLYNNLIDQVEALNRIRADKRNEQNRLDSALDDCFQLISLFFLTIGRNHEAPAVYSAVSTVKRLLDHLQEAGFYSPRDLEGIAQHIEEWESSIGRTKDNHSPHLITLLEARIDVCKETLKELRSHLSRLDPEMLETYQKLVSILRSLSACNTRSRVCS
jgi:hypothetical protein